METTLTIGLLGNKNSNNINALPLNGEASELLSSEEFSNSLALAWQEMLTEDGKLMPLDLAAFKDLSGEQLAELTKQSGIALPEQLLSDLTNATGLSVAELSELTPQELSALIKDLDRDKDLSANPAVSALLNIPLETETEIEHEISNADLLKNTAQKKVIINTSAPSDKLHTQFNSDSDANKLLNNFDNDLAKQISNLGKMNLDLKSDIDTFSIKPTFDITKLADQYSVGERSANAINPVGNQVLQSGMNQDSSATTLLRRIDVPVSQAGWGQAVGERLMMMVNDKMQSAHIHLNPPELGPIEVRVSINHDQASVHFVSSHTAVRDAIEEAFPRLKEMFMQNGLSLTDANVSQHSSKQGQQYSGEQNQTSSVIENIALDLSADTPESIIQSSIVDIGLIDHYV